MSEDNQTAPPAHQQVTEGVPHRAWQLFLDEIQSRKEDDCDNVPDDRPNR